MFDIANAWHVLYTVMPLVFWYYCFLGWSL